MPRHRRPRQLTRISGDVTAAPTIPTLGAPLAVDSTTGVISGIVLPTLTVTSSQSAAPTPSATPSAAPSTNSASSKGISTGAIIGLTVGIFAVLALALVAFMSVRHKKRIQASRARATSAASRKSWVRIHEPDEPAPAALQMRTTAHAQHPTRPGDESFLSLNSTHARALQPAPPSQNPFLAHAPARPPPAPVSPPSRGTDESHIPNPFSSPSPSPTPSHASTVQSSHAHVVATAAPLRTVAAAHTSSTASDYTYDYPFEYLDVEGPDVDSTSRFSAESAVARPQPSKQDRDRELRAMQDLISALDERAVKAPAPPSSFHAPRALKVDTSRGTSRLSMGEGLVTPGGHSIKDEADGTLPPAAVFKAALGGRN